MMKSVIGAVMLLVAMAAPLRAQTQAGPASRLEWSQGATSLFEASTLGAKLYVDALPAAVLAGKTCAGTVTPFTCVANLPAMTPGIHSIRLTVTQGTFETPQSVALSITMIVIQTPTGLRIINVTPGGISDTTPK